MGQDLHLLRYGVGGVNQAVAPTILTYNQLADSANVQITDSMLACRPGVKIHDLGIEGAFQGATFFNPAKGMSQQTFGIDESSIIARVGGMHYKIRPTGTSVESGEMDVTPLDTEATRSNDIYHLAFITQAENYIISQDGNGSTWVWDGLAPPQFSDGYNVEDKEESKLANGASAVGYAHGRIVQVVNNRQILVGDLIHKEGVSTAANILNTTEQVYWATGAYFSPPSELGAVRAVAILPQQDTQHGHGALMVHCDEGVFSLDVSLYPRTAWVDNTISKHVLLDTGATGFYAITIMDGDQIFLSRHGVQTLRSARAESSQLGNPFAPISEGVREYVDADTRENFKYASVNKFVEQRRLFCTTQHVVLDSNNRGGRGVLVLNFQPQEGTQRAWEGLWTLPSDAGLINQLVSGVFNTKERLFAFVTGEDGNVKLAEFSKDLPTDILSDGSSKEIEWQTLTRASTMGDEAESQIVEKGWVTLRDVRGGLEWEAYCRTDNTNWVLWHSGCVQECADGDLVSHNLRDLTINLGTPPQEAKHGNWFQTLFKFKGSAKLETIKVTASRDRGGKSTPTNENDCIILEKLGDDAQVFDPFSYSK